MRRGLLTVGGPPPGAPLVVGFDFASASQSGSMGASPFVWCDANPLNAAGTITSVQASFVLAGHSIAFALISPTNVVRSVSATLTSVSGSSAYAVSLAGEAGDYIGVWQQSNGAAPYYTSSVAGVTGWRNNTSGGGGKPGPGDSRPRQNTNAGLAYWIYGTG